MQHNRSLVVRIYIAAKSDSYKFSRKGEIWWKSDRAREEMKFRNEKEMEVMDKTVARRGGNGVVVRWKKEMNGRKNSHYGEENPHLKWRGRPHMEVESLLRGTTALFTYFMVLFGFRLFVKVLTLLATLSPSNYHKTYLDLQIANPKVTSGQFGSWIARVVGGIVRTISEE